MYHNWRRVKEEHVLVLKILSSRKYHLILINIFYGDFLRYELRTFYKNRINHYIRTMASNHQGKEYYER